MLKKYRQYIGLCENEFPRKKEVYKPVTDISLSKSYLKYLEDLKVTQDNRQQTVETKNSQILGQSSIVISVVSLFVPLFTNQLSDLPLYFKLPLLILFLSLVLHFILAIIHALKTLQVDKSQYMEGSTTTITKKDRAKTELLFVDEQIGDLIKMINYNNSVTNMSASNLVYASRCFKIGILVFLAFIFALLLSFAGINKANQIITISNIKDLRADTVQKINKNKHTAMPHLKIDTGLPPVPKAVSSVIRH